MTSMRYLPAEFTLKGQAARHAQKKEQYLHCLARLRAARYKYQDVTSMAE